MNRLVPLTVLALGLAFGIGDIGLTFCAHAQQEKAAEIIAVQIRKQGYTCGKAEGAERDVETSKPNVPVWILKCDNARYRVHVFGSLADKVERLD
jgi:Zn-dependent alcohol dehydrogenase